MKAILEFNLPEDKDGHIIATQGIDYICTLWDIDQLCRTMAKHGTDDDKYTICSKIRDLIADTTIFTELE